MYPLFIIGIPPFPQISITNNNLKILLAKFLVKSPSNVIKEAFYSKFC